MSAELKSIPKAYAQWLSGVDWKYFVTLHFKQGAKVDENFCVNAVKHLMIRLSAVVNGRRNGSDLSVFPVLEESSCGVPHVHLLIGSENDKGICDSIIKSRVAEIWGRYRLCINPLRLGQLNDDWFKLADGQKSRLIEYVCKEYNHGEDPVLVNAMCLDRG